MTLKQMLDAKAEKLSAIKSLEDAAKAEQRTLSIEENSQIDTLLAEAEQLDADAQALQASEQRTARLDAIRTGNTIPATPRRPQPGRQPSGAQTEQRTADDFSHEDIGRYSLLKALRCVIAKKPVDGLEGEISKEIEQRTGKVAQGFFVPLMLPLAAMASGVIGRAEQRTALNTTTAAGALMNPVMPTILDYLKARLVLHKLGAEVFANLHGTVDIPKETNDGSYSWVAEGSDVSEDSATVGQVVLNPLTIGAYLDMTRRLVNQSSFDVEIFARTRLMRSIATGVDAAGLNGDGTNKPTGILQNSNCPTVAIGTNGGALTWAKIVELESTVAAANGDGGSLHYLTSPHGRGQLKTIAKASNTAHFLEEPAGFVNGYPVESTTLVPNDLAKGSGTNLTAVIFGDFSQVKIGMWGATDVIADPYVLAKSGGVRLVALQDCDVEIGQPAALAKIVDATR